MQLSELDNGDKGVIVKVKGHGAFRKRITEMGFVKGKTIKVIKDAPLKDPVEYTIMGYDVSLRRNEAALIEVVTEREARNLKNADFQGVIDDAILKKSAREKSKNIHIALVGNPNSGKTTLFNHASRSQENVGNYSGVTVDAKIARFKYKSYSVTLTDLPGTYSATAYSPEELYVRNYILLHHPDLVINVVDASNLERNLYLTTQLIDMDIKVIVALNMYDELLEKDAKLHHEQLGRMLGIPFVPTVGARGRGITDLLDKAVQVYNDEDPTVRHIRINYGQDIEKAIKELQETIEKNKNMVASFSPRYLSIKLLEDDKKIIQQITQCDNYISLQQLAKQKVEQLEKLHKEDAETLITDAKYGFIAGALKETYTEGREEQRKRAEYIDTFLTHKVFGFPIFLFFLWLMFQATFSLGQYPQQWIELLVGAFRGMLNEFIPPGMLKNLLLDGIVNGVGGVIVFLPNILILFFFISLMEDTGYMARVAFIMDKLMHKIGLHGKSFIPLVMGFGCNVPAIMATRTLENRNDRLLTMLINPFMSCSARLPVYVLVIGAVFAEKQGLMLFTIYFTGIFIAILMAILLKKLFFRSEEAPFVMELPPYRRPTTKSILKHMWHKGVQYLKKMGGVILVASVIIWALGYFPRNIAYSQNYEAQADSLKTECFQHYRQLPDNATTMEKASLIAPYSQMIRNLEMAKESEQQSKSYIGRIGKNIEPVMAPLGFDWRMSVSILTGIAAKEIVVSTMGVLYQFDPETGTASASLKEKLQNVTHDSGPLKGQRVFSPMAAFAFLLFILIYFPCVAVIVAIKNESGSWKWALFTIIYTTGLAWLMAFIAYQVGSFLL